MEDNENNKRKDGVFGEQSETFLKVETILMLPFECLMKCNSTWGKHFILENWEKIVMLENYGYYLCRNGTSHVILKGTP